MLDNEDNGPLLKATNTSNDIFAILSTEEWYSWAWFYAKPFASCIYITWMICVNHFSFIQWYYLKVLAESKTQEKSNICK